MEDRSYISWDKETENAFVKAISNETATDIDKFIYNFITYLNKQNLSHKLNVYLLKIFSHIQSYNLKSNHNETSHFPKKLVENLFFRLSHKTVLDALLKKNEANEIPLLTLMLTSEIPFLNTIIKILEIDLDVISALTIKPSRNQEIKNRLTKKLLELIDHHKESEVLTHLLLKFGAELHPPLSEDLPRTPLHVAIQQGHNKIFSILLSYDTDNNFVNFKTFRNSRTLAHYSVIFNQPEMLKQMFLKMESDESKLKKFFTDRDQQGCALLHFIALTPQKQNEFTTVIRTHLIPLGYVNSTIGIPIVIDFREEFKVSKKRLSLPLRQSKVLVFTPFTLAYIFGNSRLIDLIIHNFKPRIDTKAIIDLLFQIDPSLQGRIMLRDFLPLKDNNVFTSSDWRNLQFKHTVFDSTIQTEQLNKNQEDIRTALIKIRENILLALNIITLVDNRMSGIQHISIPAQKRSNKAATFYANNPLYMQDLTLYKHEYEKMVSKPAIIAAMATQSRSGTFKEPPPEDIPQLPGLSYQPIPRDGHCLLEAVALHLGKGAEELRKEILSSGETIEGLDTVLLKHNKTPQDYFQHLRDRTEWEYVIELDAMMWILDTPILIVEPKGNITNEEIKNTFTNQPIYVFHLGNGHFDAFGPEEEIRAAEELIKSQTSPNPIRSSPKQSHGAVKSNTFNYGYGSIFHSPRQRASSLINTTKTTEMDDFRSLNNNNNSHSDDEKDSLIRLNRNSGSDSD